MAASYVELEDGNGELQAIETDEEWELIQNAITQFEDENMSECDECDDDSDCASCPYSK